MDPNELATNPANGTITYVNREDAAGDIPWTPHPKYKGVSLKHLIKGMDTEGRLSCHIVKIAPHSVLEEHAHEHQWELHEVIAGEGVFLLDAKETTYHAGRMGMIPRGTRHKVIAGNTGLVLLATFFPALL
jgi:quercetin dioxygenase-like cupin family protein